MQEDERDRRALVDVLVRGPVAGVAARARAARTWCRRRPRPRLPSRGRPSPTCMLLGADGRRSRAGSRPAYLLVGRETYRPNERSGLFSVQPSIDRSVLGRMPPARKTWRSNGVSIRARMVKARPSASTVTSNGSGPSAAIASSPSDAVALVAGEPERGRRLPRLELEREHTHAHEVRAVDALVALGEHRAHAEQERALRGPVARRARAVLLARDHDAAARLRSRTASRRRRSWWARRRAGAR